MIKPANQGEPLDGLRVVVLDGLLAAGYITVLLASQGASVTRVLGPWSAVARSGQQSWLPPHHEVTVGETTTAGLADAALSKADVVIDATGSTHLPGWQFGWQQVSQRRPHVVYCRVPAFAAPASAGASDAVVSGALGLGQPDAAEPLPIPSFCGALMCVFWVAVAVAGHSGEGPVLLETPQFNAALTLLGRNLITLHDARLRDPMSGPRLPLNENYECADGRYVQFYGVSPQWAALIVGVGQPDLVEGAARAMAGLRDDEAVADWRSRLSRMSRRLTSKQWEDRVAAQQGACTICRTTDEWAAEPHAAESGVIERAQGTAGPAAVSVGAPVRVICQAPPPGQRSGPIRPAVPVPGLRVLDLCIVLAGPTCGRALAEAGADVIKVDAPDRSVNPFSWLDVNRGKRSLLLDLRRSEGRDVLWRLIEQADVLIENFRSGKLDALGFGYDAVAARCPHLIYASFNAFDYGGRWERRPGWEGNAEAATGMQTARARFGRPEHVPVPVNDYGTGLLGAFAVVCGLLERNRTGRGVRVLGSLARTASFIQQPQIVRPSSGPAGDVPGRQPGQRSEHGTQQASRPVTPRELLSSAALRDDGLVVEWEHEAWGTITQLVGGPSMSPDFRRPQWPAPDPGQHSEDILLEAGFAVPEVAGLMSGSIAVGRRPLFPSAHRKVSGG
jgi:crotonobetainyl-CoA:carnitine CoA-transferase CaiB-like acyl-CoA transferase